MLGKLCYTIFIILQLLKGVAMCFLDRLFKKQGQQEENGDCQSSIKTHSYIQKDDEFKVVIDTDRELSEEEQKDVFAIVKDGIYIHNQHPSNVCIRLMLKFDIIQPIIYNRLSKWCVKLHF